MHRLELLSRISKVIKSISLKSPEINDIIVFDNAGSDIIGKMILYEVDFTVIYSREEKIYLSYAIILLMIRNIRLIDWKYYKKYKQNRIRQIFRELYKLYFYSCLLYVKPKVVVTFVDNNYWFQMMSRFYKGAVFYAIQNGCRIRYSVTTWLPQAPDPGCKIHIPNFFCFGKYEKDLYEKYNHCVERYIPIGSVRGSYYRENLALNKKEIEYDICLVSEWGRSIMEQGLYPEIKRALLIIHEYLKRFIEESRMSFCVATRSDDQAEKSYFRDYFGEKVKIFDFSLEEMSTYHAMDKSFVIVTFNSTAALEAFGWGKKVLFCNFSGDEGYDLPQQGIWTINKIDYNLFKKKINYLLKIDEITYADDTAKPAQYLMNYIPQSPTHLLVRETILKELPIPKLAN